MPLTPLERKRKQLERDRAALRALPDSTYPFLRQPFFEWAEGTDWEAAEHDINAAGMNMPVLANDQGPKSLDGTVEQGANEDWHPYAGYEKSIGRAESMVDYLLAALSQMTVAINAYKVEQLNECIAELENADLSTDKARKAALADIVRLNKIKEQLEENRPGFLPAVEGQGHLNSAWVGLWVQSQIHPGSLAKQALPPAITSRKSSIMPIVIDHISTAAIAASNPHGSYPNVVVVDFGRPRFNYCPISMRDLIQWRAYRLDSDDGNHRAAILLRAVADHFYPIRDDQADWIIEDLEDRGIPIDHDFDDVSPPAVDLRLLGLVDGLVSDTETFDEVLWEGQEPTPALVRSAANYLDFMFPDEAFNLYGIRGIRIYVLELIHWFQSSIDLREMAHQDEEAWLDAWELSSDRHSANDRYRAVVRLRARHGDDAVNGRSQPSSRGTTDPTEQDAVLAELAGLI
ncbi:hypothetical protein [Devosia riboflavina]